MKFFVSRNGQPETEVSKAEFVRAEREAGFYPRLGGTYRDLATDGFSSATPLGGREIRGRIESDQSEGV